MDHAFLLLNWYSHLRPDKIELAIQLDSCACLPLPLATLLNVYKFRKATFNEGSDPEILAKYSTFEEYESHTREAFIKDFTAWETRIRALAKTPPPVVGLELPPEVQLVETKINKLLEEPFPTSEEELSSVDDLIEPFWQQQLSELRERRWSRLLAENKITEEIALEDMRIDTFRHQFKDFKTRCRIRGFRVIQPSPGIFIAHEPESVDFDALSAKQHLLGPVEKIDTYPEFVFHNLHGNEIREQICKIETEINDLLSSYNENRSGSGESNRSSSRTFEDDRRLMDLLRPFFPAPIAKADDQLRGLRFMNQPSSRDERIRRDRTTQAWMTNFLDGYEPWLRRLSQTGVRISLDPVDEQLDGPTEGILYFRHALIKEEPDQMAEQEDTTTALLSPRFRKLQDDINDLLQQRNTGSLTLEQEYRLRYLLRAVMPHCIGSLDDQLRAIAKRARSEHLQDEVVEYIALSERWRKEYYAWLTNSQRRVLDSKRESLETLRNRHPAM